VLSVAPQPGGGIPAEGEDLVPIGLGLGGEGRHEDSRGAGSAQGGRRLHIVDHETARSATIGGEDHLILERHFQTSLRGSVG